LLTAWSWPRTRRRTRPPHRASSMDVDARLTPPDPPGKPAAPAQPGSPELRAAPGCGTIAFRESDRPADPRADERNGDVSITRPAGGWRSVCRDSDSARRLLDRRFRVSTDRTVRRHEGRATVGGVIEVIDLGLSLRRAERKSRPAGRRRC
jgi:hypothetical protein